MSDLTDRLDEIEARADAATPGPWEADVTEVSQHWSRPEPWATVVSSEVHCMAYCYGGIGRGIEREADAEFIAAARTALPKALDALEAVLALWPDTDPCDCCVHVDCEVVRAIAEALGIEP